MGKSIVSNHPNVHPNSRCNLLFPTQNKVFPVVSRCTSHHPICPEAHRGFHGLRIPPHSTSPCSGAATSSSTGISNRLWLRSGRRSQSWGHVILASFALGISQSCENWEVPHFEDSGLWLRDSIWCFFFASILLGTVWETLYFETSSQKNVPIDISLHQLRLRSGRRWTIALCARSDDPLWLQNGPPEFRQGSGMLQHTILRRQYQAARVKNLWISNGNPWIYIYIYIYIYVYIYIYSIYIYNVYLMYI